MRLALALLALAACDGTRVPDGVDTDADTDAFTEGPDLSGLDGLLDDSFAANDLGIGGMLLVVVDSETDVELYRRTSGNLASGEVIPVASASKLVSGLVLARLVTKGDLGLESTTGEVLGWRAERGQITLDQLGAFTSGLPESTACVYRPGTTLEACVDQIATLPLAAAPGTRLDYGSTHLAVAGRMAETVQGEPWNVIFDSMLKAPLGLDDPATTYVTLPKQPDTDGANPLIAGGLRISPDDYLRLLRLVDDRGELDGEAFIEPALIDRMFENRYADAELGTIPSAAASQDWRYGWTGWLECPGRIEACSLMSSPGAYGFTPWVDRDHGYYAILAMESADVGGGAFSVEIEQQVQAAIVEALGR